MGELLQFERTARRRPEAMDTKADVAAHFKVSERTIERWMDRGMPFDKPFEGGCVRYRIVDCDAWFRRRR